MSFFNDIFDDNNYLIWILLFFCLCDDIDDIFDDIEDWLPWIILLFCICND